MINMDNKARLFRAPVELFVLSYLCWLSPLLSELKQHEIALYNADMVQAKQCKYGIDHYLGVLLFLAKDRTWEK